MPRAPRSMPNSSGGTPITLACASFRVVTMVTSCVTGGASGVAAGPGSRGTAILLSLCDGVWDGLNAWHPLAQRTVRLFARQVIAQEALEKIGETAGQ